jgi:CheY-like chemotaxis protein
MTARRALPNANMTPEDLSGLKVLVVDDHQNTVRLVSDVLRAGGVGQVYTANDGIRAREVLYRSHPDIIFTDLRMPLMDGLELTRSIRQAAVVRDAKVPNPEVPIILLTGERSERDVEAARLAGVNEFVIKPFTPAALLSRIQLVQRKPRPFIVSDVYVGPDRRRRAEISYSGPLRRDSDPAEVVDSVERETTRETIGVEVEALRRLIVARGGADRATMQMAYRVMQHTRFRARQVRDKMVERASSSMLQYVDATDADNPCDPAMLDLHFTAIKTLLALPETDGRGAIQVVRDLEAAVSRKLRFGAVAA